MDDPFIQNIVGDLGKLDPSIQERFDKARAPKPPESGENPEPDPSKKDGQPTTPAASEPPKPADPPKKPAVRKGKSVAELIDEAAAKAGEAARRASEPPPAQHAPEPPQAQPQKPQPKPAQPEPAADKPELAGLDDRQKEFAEIAEFAEASDEKHKGLRKKVLDFFASDRAYREQALKEDPDRTFDEDDTDYQKWLRSHRPIDRDTYYDLRADYRAERRVSAKLSEADKRLAEETSKVQKRVRAIEARPNIEEAGRKAVMLLRDNLKAKDGVVKEVAEAIEKHGWDSDQVPPLFAEQLRHTASTAAALASEYMAITSGAVDVDLDNNPRHQWLGKFITEQSGLLMKMDAKARARDGKDFRPRSQLAQLRRTDPDADSKYWTFGDDDVLEMIAINGARFAHDEISKLQQQLERSGFKRVAPQAAPSNPGSTPPPVPGASPAASATPAPGAAETPPPQNNSPFSSDEVSALMPFLNQK
jgi:hypothetical protein